MYIATVTVQHWALNPPHGSMSKLGSCFSSPHSTDDGWTDAEEAGADGCRQAQCAYKHIKPSHARSSSLFGSSRTSPYEKHIYEWVGAGTSCAGADGACYCQGLQSRAHVKVVSSIADASIALGCLKYAGLNENYIEPLANQATVGSLRGTTDNLFNATN